MIGAVIALLLLAYAALIVIWVAGGYLLLEKACLELSLARLELEKADR